jgi:pimeloyl-ACP methyl ester carboxylesterase
MVGMRLALAHPERVTALALLDTSARSERPAKIPGYKVLAAIGRTIGPIPLLARPILPLFFCPKTRSERPALAEAFVENLLRMDPISLGHAVDAVIFHRDDVSEDLGRITAPTLVLVGVHDRATPPSESELIASKVPGATLVRIPDAAHLSALENPARVNESLLTFLAAHAG